MARFLSLPTSSTTRSAWVMSWHQKEPSGVHNKERFGKETSAAPPHPVRAHRRLLLDLLLGAEAAAQPLLVLRRCGGEEVIPMRRHQDAPLRMPEELIGDHEAHETDPCESLHDLALEEERGIPGTKRVPPGVKFR